MRKFIFKCFGFSAAIFLSISNLGLANDTFAAMLDNNTMKVIGPDGTVQNWYFHPDGTFSSLENVTGSWTMEGDILCTLYGERTKPGCFSLPTGKAIGDTWNQVVGSGKTLKVIIVKGRQAR
ncbi:hypothetical protein MNBD_ALPHA03-1236 [hydrothermal vent metagenome]|uniref:Uncharacterized protein n=1 Tax=hydrothermal vent metagenome TaxID=652676 RepID=A0A3B1B5I0_9ZZZZ